MATSKLSDISGISPNELAFLYRLFNQAYRAVITPYKHNPKDLSTGQSRAAVDTMGILSISFRMPNPRDFVEPVNIRNRGVAYCPDDRESVCFRERLPVVSSALETCMAEIEKAKAAGRVKTGRVHFLLFNELAIGSKDVEAVLKSLKHNFAIPFDSYIVPGTFHCVRSFLNVAPIITPNGDGKIYSTAVLKQNSAHRMSEKIRTQDYRSLHIFKTDYANIGIWICLDLYDPALVAKLLSHNHRLSHTRDERLPVIDLLLVPSYSTDDEKNLRDSARDISRLCRTNIVIANDCTNFMKKQAGWTNNFCYTVGTEMPGLTISSTNDWLGTYFELDWKKYQDKKHGPFAAGDFSSLFGQIVGAKANSFQNVPD